MKYVETNIKPTQNIELKDLNGKDYMLSLEVVGHQMKKKAIENHLEKGIKKED